MSPEYSPRVLVAMFFIRGTRTLDARYHRIAGERGLVEMSRRYILHAGEILARGWTV